MAGWRKLMQRLAAVDDPRSLANWFRRRRFVRVAQFIDESPSRPVRILDVGGTPGFWRQMGRLDDPNLELVLLNVDAPKSPDPAVQFEIGTATDLSRFDDGAFDIAFSNSVIEHVGSWSAQRAMAREMQRVSRRYLLQTPNRWFPIEPHLHFPFFAVLPMKVRVFLLQHLSLGWRGKIPDPAAARERAEFFLLLSGRDLRLLFPAGRIEKERILGFVKSLTVLGDSSVSEG